MALLTSLLLGACASPDSRIRNHPEIYSTLTSEEQTAVRNGQVLEGMSKPAVFLAWGNPSRTVQGEREGRFWEEWLWVRRMSASPVVGGGVGLGGGGYGGVGLGLPSNRAAWRGARFEQDQLVSWWTTR